MTPLTHHHYEHKRSSIRSYCCSSAMQRACSATKTMTPKTREKRRDGCLLLRYTLSIYVPLSCGAPYLLVTERSNLGQETRIQRHQQLALGTIWVSPLLLLNKPLTRRPDKAIFEDIRGRLSAFVGCSLRGVSGEYRIFSLAVRCDRPINHELPIFPSSLLRMKRYSKNATYYASAAL